jgi:hypothetical protein
MHLFDKSLLLEDDWLNQSFLLKDRVIQGVACLVL